MIMIRLSIVLILSGAIGFERELKKQSAGFRTHILVGIGSCLLMLLSLYGFESFIEKYDNVRFDPARIPSYVVSGIGFLGAGTIIVYGRTIRGLTTAASIWAVAGIGLVVGAGMYATALFTTILILLSLSFLNKFEKVFINRVVSRTIQIVVLPEMDIKQITSALKSLNIEISELEIVSMENGFRNIFIKPMSNSKVDQIELFDVISKIENVKSISDKS